MANCTQTYEDMDVTNISEHNAKVGNEIYVVMVTLYIATYITFPHTYFVMDSISEINDFSIQLNENSPLKCLLVKCLLQQIRK